MSNSCLLQQVAVEIYRYYNKKEDFSKVKLN